MFIFYRGKNKCLYISVTLLNKQAEQNAFSLNIRPDLIPNVFIEYN